MFCSGSSGSNPVKVQVLSRAKEEAIRKGRLFLWGPEKGLETECRREYLERRGTRHAESTEGGPEGVGTMPTTEGQVLFLWGPERGLETECRRDPRTYRSGVRNVRQERKSAGRRFRHGGGLEPQAGRRGLTARIDILYSAP